MLLAKGEQFLRQGGASVGHLDWLHDGLDLLLQVRIRHPEDRDVGDFRVGDEQVLPQ